MSCVKALSLFLVSTLLLASPPPKDERTQPAPQLEKLIHALSGEWATEETYEPSDFLPKGGKGHSTDTYRPGPARLSLIEEYHSQGDAGESSGIGIIWWQPEAQRFSFVWCDSFALDKGCRVSDHAGRWEGNNYVLSDEHMADGKRVYEKEVWSDFTPDSYTQTLYVGDAPEKLRPLLTIKATRVKR